MSRSKESRTKEPKTRESRARDIGKKRAKAEAPAHRGVDLHFTQRNYMILGGALASILVGFLLLSQGSITAAPILLVLGYCILVPYGLATGQRRDPLESGE